jgi:hypothetical protein
MRLVVLAFVATLAGAISGAGAQDMPTVRLTGQGFVKA